MLLHVLAAVADSPHGHHSLKHPDGTFFATSNLILLATLVVFSTILLSSLIWIFFDARSRQKSGLIAILFILITGWPLSFIWWLWLRPAIRSRR